MAAQQSTNQQQSGTLNLGVEGQGAIRNFKTETFKKWHQAVRGTRFGIFARAFLHQPETVFFRQRGNSFSGPSDKDSVEAIKLITTDLINPKKIRPTFLRNLSIRTNKDNTPVTSEEIEKIKSFFTEEITSLSKIAGAQHSGGRVWISSKGQVLLVKGAFDQKEPTINKVPLAKIDQSKHTEIQIFNSLPALLRFFEHIQTKYENENKFVNKLRTDSQSLQFDLHTWRKLSSAQRNEVLNSTYQIAGESADHLKRPIHPNKKEIQTQARELKGVQDSRGRTNPPATESRARSLEQRTAHRAEEMGGIQAAYIRDSLRALNLIDAADRQVNSIGFAVRKQYNQDVGFELLRKELLKAKSDSRECLYHELSLRDADTSNLKAKPFSVLADTVKSTRKHIFDALEKGNKASFMRHLKTIRDTARLVELSRDVDRVLERSIANQSEPAKLSYAITTAQKNCHSLQLANPRLPGAETALIEVSTLLETLNDSFNPKEKKQSTDFAKARKLLSKLNQNFYDLGDEINFELA